MNNKVTVYVKIRRFDLKDKPEFESKHLEINPKLDYNSLKNEVRCLFGVAEDDEKVIKLRNKDCILIPLMNLLEGNSPENYYIVDVSKIQHTAKTTVNLQDAYLDAVRQKLHNIESRITQAEVLIPQIQLERQAHMEQTVHNMSTRVAFLNRRIDELMPPQWKSKMPVTIS
ncbi:hypothetical protein ILUMI_21268 [Ignelater luminosus]|uniref:Uncharacterized protein n=1 Tax=Ignelater luminosus TaxID=2038154 RepID=A0A8K0CGM6_IGNLU|nr:hypothetical protein ILUMI_21268 [Ignelater luminosus]